MALPNIPLLDSAIPLMKDEIYLWDHVNKRIHTYRYLFLIQRDLEIHKDRSAYYVFDKRTDAPLGGVPYMVDLRGSVNIEYEELPEEFKLRLTLLGV